MTKSERQFLGRVAEQGCILCRRLGHPGTPAEIHHLRSGMGKGQRNTNQNVIPLCPEHHRGNTGYHGLGRRAFERMYGVTELDLLRETWEVMDSGRAERISHNNWSTADEAEYHQNIQSMAKVVHWEAA
ncbi:Ref family recombination enhancement nuclease [Castellaniella ginsengisoli]